MWRDLIKLFRGNNLQVQALNECYEMLDLSQAMVMASVESLRRRDDAAVDIDIYLSDKKLNSFERDVRRKVMTHLMLGHRPDIAAGLALVSVVIDIERIGDYSKNIHDLAVRHPRRLHGGPLEGQIARIEQHSLENFEKTVRTFQDGDVEVARQIMEAYKQDISQQCEEVVEQLVSGKVEIASSESATLALYARFLKRISAHSRNLISSIVNPFDRIGYRE